MAKCHSRRIRKRRHEEEEVEEEQEKNEKTLKEIEDIIYNTYLGDYEKRKKRDEREVMYYYYFCLKQTDVGRYSMSLNPPPSTPPPVNKIHTVHI